MVGRVRGTIKSHVPYTMGRVHMTINVLRHSVYTETARRTLPRGPGLSTIGRNMIGLASCFGYIIVKYPTL